MLISLILSHTSGLQTLGSVLGFVRSVIKNQIRCPLNRCFMVPPAVWGVGAGAAVAYLMSDVPVFQKDVLLKIPVVRLRLYHISN